MTGAGTVVTELGVPSDADRAGELSVRVEFHKRQCLQFDTGTIRQYHFDYEAHTSENA